MNLINSNSIDHLTQCLNRGSLDRYIDLQLSPFDVKMSFPKSISFIDIDYFGKFNKDYGHQEGDLVLKEVSKTLKETIDSNGTVYRCSYFIYW